MDMILMSALCRWQKDMSGFHDWDLIGLLVLMVCQCHWSCSQVSLQVLQHLLLASYIQTKTVLLPPACDGWWTTDGLRCAGSDPVLPIMGTGVVPVYLMIAIWGKIRCRYKVHHLYSRQFAVHPPCCPCYGVLGRCAKL